MFLDSDESYLKLNLMNKEISFDIDLSKVPCGVDANFLLTSAEKDGSMSKTNSAGAKFGSGYCDATCGPRAF